MKLRHTITAAGLGWSLIFIAAPRPAAGQAAAANPTAAGQPPLPSLAVILRGARRAQAASDRALEQYEWRERERVEYLRGNGSVSKTETRTYLVSTVAGREFRELTEKDGKPLPAKKRAAERQKLLRRAEWAERHPRKAAKRKLRAERRRKQFRDAIPQAFHLRLLGKRESAQGCVYAIDAQPRRHWRAPNKSLKLLQKIDGRFWVACRDFQVVALRLRVLKTISYGWLIARIEPGARMHLQMAAGQHHPAFPARLTIQADARLLIFKHYRLRTTVVYDHYRPFKVTTKAQSAKRRAQSAKRRAQSAERKAQSAERKAQSAERRAQSAEHRA